MFKRLLLSAFLSATLVLSSPPAIAYEIISSPIKVTFIDLKAAGQEFGDVTLTVQPATGATNSADELPDLSSSASVSWRQATISFSFTANNSTYRFNWEIGNSLLSDTRITANSAKESGFLEMLENFSVGMARFSDGEVTITKVADQSGSVAFTLLHEALDLDDLADGSIRTLAARTLTLTGDIGDGDDQMTLALDIDRTTATGFDLAYPVIAFSSTLSEYAPDLTTTEYLRTLYAYAAVNVGYDTLDLETVSGLTILDGERYSLSIDNIHNGLNRGYVAGPGSLNGLKINAGNAGSLLVESITATGYDLTEAADDIRERLRTEPEIFDLEVTEPALFLASLPPMDLGKFSVNHVMISEGNKSLTLSNLSVNDIRVDASRHLNFGFSINGLALPAHIFDEQTDNPVRKVLDYTGLDQLKIHLNHHFTLDPKAGVLNVSSFDVTMDGLAAYASQFELIGLTIPSDDGNYTYPKVVEADLTIHNDTLVDALLATASAENQNPDVLRRNAEQNLRNLQDRMTTKPGKAVYGEVIKFLNGSPRLAMSLAPQNPVPLDQVFGLLALSADAAVQFLGLKVTAGP